VSEDLIKGKQSLEGQASEVKDKAKIFSRSIGSTTTL